MNSPSIHSGNMSMNSLNTSSHNAERIQALCSYDKSDLSDRSLAAAEVLTD